MKKGTLFGILFAVISIIALGVLTVYVTLNFREEAFFATSQQIESEADAAMKALYESQPQTEQPSAEKTNTNTKIKSETATPAHDPVIWVGDSRTLGMRNAVENTGKDVFIGADGEGYKWLSETGVPQLREAVAEFPDAPVVFNFGVNDYDSLSNYMALYEALTTEYTDTVFYFLSVNPIEPTICKNITNEEIADFNAHLKEAYPDTYIDSFTMLMIEQTVTIDGVHYSKEDYQKIYEFALAQIY